MRAFFSREIGKAAPINEIASSKISKEKRRRKLRFGELRDLDEELYKRKGFYDVERERSERWWWWWYDSALCCLLFCFGREKEGEDWIEKQRADAYHNFFYFLFFIFILYRGFTGKKKKKEEIIVSWQWFILTAVWTLME